MTFHFCSVLTASLLLVVETSAQQVDLDRVDIEATEITKDLHILAGREGALGVLTGADGILVIDGAAAPFSDAIGAAIRKISNDPIRYVVDISPQGESAASRA